MDINIVDIQSDDIFNKFTITIYGKTTDDTNIVCHVVDYRPVFYIKIPDTWTINKTITCIFNELKYKPFKGTEYKNLYKDQGYYSCDVTILDELYNDLYISTKKFKYVELTFSNYRSFVKYRYSIKELFNKETCNKEWKDICIDECCANLYEANIHPVLRFIHDKDIDPSGWIKIHTSHKSVREIPDEIKSFKCDIEYKCKCCNIIKINNDSISNLTIASFDIECDSLTGEFPQAKKTFKKLAHEIYSIYCKYNIGSIELIKDIIKCSFGLIDNNIYQYFDEISRTETINGLPYNIDKLSFLKDTFINELDESKDNKKLREKCITQLTTILDIELKNNNGDLIKVKGDPIIQIGTVFYYMDKKEYKRVIQVIKPDELDEKVCDSLDNIIVEECENEKDLIKKWQNCINKYNPDMITGYNIFGFDFKYIVDRCEQLNIQLDNLGRLNTNNDGYEKHYNKQCKLKNMNFSKKLEGDAFNNPYYINMDGRVIFDVQKEITKLHNLSSYKLDTVASYFMRGSILKQTIHDIDINHLTINYNDKFRTWLFKTNNIGHLKSGDYITINVHSNIGETLLFDGRKFKIFTINDLHINIYIDDLDINTEIGKFKPYKIEWCMNKDDVPPQEIFNLHKTGGPVGRAKVAKYCIQDCELCIHLINLLDLIPNNMGMSNVCLVPLSFIFLRGQGIKVTSLVSKYCKNSGTKMPTLKDYKEDNSGYEGAIVLEPKTGIYLEDPIVVLDYASLYPSSIIEKNLSPDTYIRDTNYIKENIKNLNMIDYDDYEYDTTKKTIKKVKMDTKTECYFIPNKKDDNGNIIPSSMGIIPTVLQTLLSARKDTKRRLKNETNDFKKKILDGLQLAYKLTANSVYGQLGAKTSSVYMKKIAACTTSIGRQRITVDAQLGVKEWAKEKGYEEPDIIYGDTDSVFIKFSRKNLEGVELKGNELLKHAIQCGIDAGKFVDKTLDAPQNLEYEKTFMPFILMSKKRYIGDKYEWIEDVDKKNCKRTSMGIVMKRRDNAPIVKYVYGNMIEKIMVDRNYEKTLKWLKKTLRDICRGTFHVNYFIISKSLNGFYKNPESIAHKVLADRIGARDPGNKPKANDRIPYLYVEVEEREQVGYTKIKKRISNGFFKNGKEKFKTIMIDGEPKYKKRHIVPGERIESPEYVLEKGLKIDYRYYISNQIMNPVIQVLDLNDRNNDNSELFNVH